MNDREPSGSFFTHPLKLGLAMGLSVVIFVALLFAALPERLLGEPRSRPAQDRPAWETRRAGAAALVQQTRRPQVTLDVDLHFAEDYMEVRQVVGAPNTTEDTWTELVFNVTVAHEPEAFSLDGAAAGGASSAQPVVTEQDGETLRVPLPRSVAPGQTARVELAYTVRFLPYGPEATFPQGMTGRTGEVIRAAWWYPVLVPYASGEGWQTWDYHIVGDPVTFPAADYTLTINAEPGVVVAGSEPVSEEDGVWTFRAEAGRAIAFFASDAYVVTEGEADGVPIHSYHFAGDEVAGQATVDVAARALELFAELFGPYPYESLVLVRSRSNSDMEYTGLMSLSEEVYQEFWGTPQSALMLLVPHEMAHQWWYGAVGNDQVYEPWLDEGLATYSEVLYFERYHPEVGEQRLSIYRNRAQPGPLDVSIYDYDTTTPYVRDLYPRAAMLIHELRGQMGDEAFFEFLHDYRETYAGQLATAEDFRETAQAHSDADLAPLWEPYFGK